MTTDQTEAARADSAPSASAPPLSGPTYSGAERMLAMLAATLLFSMMVLTFVDVVLRYVFNSPIKGSFEVSETLMAVLIFAGLPLVSRHGEHITIDSLTRLAPAVVQRIGAVIVQLGCAAGLVGMAWLLWLKASRFAAAGDVTQTLKLPIAPVVQLMALLTLVTALVHILLAWRSLRQPPSTNQSGAEAGGVL